MANWAADALHREFKINSDRHRPLAHKVISKMLMSNRYGRFLLAHENMYSSATVFASEQSFGVVALHREALCSGKVNRA
jgi:hypothetical protein